MTSLISFNIYKTLSSWLRFLSGIFRGFSITYLKVGPFILSTCTGIIGKDNLIENSAIAVAVLAGWPKKFIIS